MARHVTTSRFHFACWISMLAFASLLGCDLSPQTKPVPVLHRPSEQSDGTDLKDQGGSAESITNDQTNRESSNHESSDTTATSAAPSDELYQLGTEVTVRLSNDSFDGSGVVVGQKGSQVFILTVAHAAVEEMDCVDFFNPSSDKPQLTVHAPKVLSTEERADLAVLAVEVPPGFQARVVKIAEPPDLVDASKGSRKLKAWSVGCGAGRAPAMFRESIEGAGTYTISRKNGPVKRHMWKARAPQEGGRSGGPLLSVQGDLLGIALGKYAGNGFYAHLSEISKYFIDTDLESLLTYAEASQVTHPPLGE